MTRCDCNDCVISDVRAWAPALNDRKGLRDQPRLHNFPLVTSEAPAELGVKPGPLTAPLSRSAGGHAFLYTEAQRGRPWPALP